MFTDCASGETVSDGVQMGKDILSNMIPTSRKETYAYALSVSNITNVVENPDCILRDEEEIDEVVDLNTYVSMICPSDADNGVRRKPIDLISDGRTVGKGSYTEVQVFEPSRGIYGFCMKYPRLWDRTTMMRGRTDGDDDGTSQTDMYECKTCHRQYLDAQSFFMHGFTCKAEETGKAFLRKSLEVSERMITSRDIPIPLKRQSHHAMEQVSVASAMRQKKKFRAMWAQRETQGQTIGRNTVSIFLTDIKEWLLAGEVNKSQRMPKPVMKSTLLAKYPHQYDIPTEQHLGAVICSMKRQYNRQKSMSGYVHRTRKSVTVSVEGNTEGGAVTQAAGEAHRSEQGDDVVTLATKQAVSQAMTKAQIRQQSDQTGDVQAVQHGITRWVKRSVCITSVHTVPHVWHMLDDLVKKDRELMPRNGYAKLL